MIPRLRYCDVANTLLGNLENLYRVYAINTLCNYTDAFRRTPNRNRHLLRSNKKGLS